MRHPTFILATLLACLVLAPSAAGQTQVYVYVDESGAYHFSDQRLTPDYKPFVSTKSAARSAPRAPVGTYTTAPEPRYVRAIEALIAEISNKYGIDANLVRAVAKVESNFNPWAVSKSGARGIMQIMPETAADYGITDVHDPRQNLEAGIQILCDLMIRFDGELPFVLAAYNAGLTTVQEHRGVPPYAETREYIDRVTRWYLRYCAESSP